MTSQAVPELTLREHQARVKDAIDDALDAARGMGYAIYWEPPRQIPEVEELHQLSPDLQRSVVIDLIARQANGAPIRERLRRIRTTVSDRLVYGRLLASFSNRAIPYTRTDAVILLHLASTLVRGGSEEAISAVPQTVGAVERIAQREGVAELTGAIEELARNLGSYSHATRAAKYRARLVALLSEAAATVDPHMVTDGDSWGRTWRSRLAGIPPSLHPLLVQLTLVAAVEPTQKWKATMRELAATPAARELLSEMLADVESTRAVSLSLAHRWYVDDPSQLPIPTFQDRNALVLRGVIWAAALSGADWAARRISEIGVVCGTSGGTDNTAREERLANTCAAALGAIDTEAAFAGLARMKAKVTNRNVSKQIAKALEAAAVRAGTSPSELLELAVPTLGLDAAGQSAERIGDQTAVLSIGPDGSSRLVWREPNGDERASPSKRTAETYPADVRRLKESAKDLKKALSMERARIEDLFVEQREWDLPTWRARYIEHPMTGSLGRRLIWRMSDPDGRSTTVMVEGDAYVTADGSPESSSPAARIRLWHPIDASETEISAWRQRVVDRRIRQPFKQAFREVYLLTPAEEETETYSNRFAAHILLYPQARALMTARRWASNFLGPFDGGYQGIAKREFPSHQLRAEFFHDSLEPDGDVLHCSTDQVRFAPLGRGAPEVIALRDVPPIVFSEAMRDVDLFVGVASVGADRNWQDAGQDRAGRYAQLDAYFTNYFDQSLTASAQVRRDALGRILPGLVIADRVELLDRWLRVRGDRRSYKIHLGSGNILMEPSDTYLCIVPGRGQRDASRVFLPFDDDPMLSLILSKAMLLANDKEIKDQSILSQMRQR